MAKIKAVVFDLDGVLINSEPLAFRAWLDVLQPYGCKLTDEQNRSMIGQDVDVVIQQVARVTGVPLGSQELKRVFFDRFLRILDLKLEPMPGVVELVETLYRCGYPLGVASNSAVDYIERALKAIRVRDRFQAVVSRDMVRRGKPEPDVYLAAAERLRVLPGNCLAVEDSTFGMQAALSAGMACVVVAEDAHRNGFQAAHARFTTLVELRGSLDRLLRN
jgi:HAD superfamily hydrolase (TIGR01509 family)